MNATKPDLEMKNLYRYYCKQLLFLVVKHLPVSSGHAAAPGDRQHAALAHQHRHLHVPHSLHPSLVPRRHPHHRRNLRAALRRVPDWDEGATKTSPHVLVATVESHRRVAEGTDEHQGFREAGRVQSQVNDLDSLFIYLFIY